MAQISADRKIAHAESETTYGVDAISPGPVTEWEAFRDISIIPTINTIESPRATYSASGEKHCQLPSHNAVTWEMPFGGKIGAAGTAPAYDALLLASGFKKTVVASTSVTYTPVTVQDMTNSPSASIWMYRMMLDQNAAYLYKARGYRGNVTITLNYGEEAVIAGDGLALYDAMPTSTVSKPSAPTDYVGSGCMVVSSLVLTVGGTNYPVDALEIQTNWTQTRRDTGDGAGAMLAEVYLTRPTSGGRMIGSLNLVDGLTALQDAVGKWQSGAQATLSAVLTNGSNTITINAPSIQFGQPAEGAEGILSYNIPIYFNRGTGTVGDNEISIIYT